MNLHVGTQSERPRPQGEYRYGIFIRPPAAVSLPALEMMRVARDLFGFHAAAAYPPHITLIGSIALNGEEGDLIEVVSGVLKDRSVIPIHGVGLDAAIGAAVGIDYNRTRKGERNLPLVNLYEDLRRETAHLRRFEPSDRKAQQRRDNEAQENFRAHLTVLGHDGIDNPTARDEARSALEHLATAMPRNWIAETVTMYRFWSESWEAKYWLTQEWIPVASWRLKY